MARITHTQNLRAPVARDEDLINHAWYRFLRIMLVLGGTALLLWLLYGGFRLGRWTVPASQPAVAAPATRRVMPVRRPAAAKAVAVHTPAPVLAPAAAIDLTPIERGLGQVADAVRDIHNDRSATAQQQPLNEYGEPQPANACTGLSPAEERRCRIWKQLD